MPTNSSLPLKRLGWLFLLFTTFVIFNSCKKKNQLISVDPAFSKYIDGYTSGVISKKNTIRIQLATEANYTHSVNESIKDDIFDFSPSIKGKAYWVDSRTIEFKPAADLDIDQLYEAQFKLDKVLNVPSSFKNFKFNFKTIRPSFEVEEIGLKGTTKELMTLAGKIFTADIEQSDKIEKILSASLNGVNLSIKWQHNEINKTHEFVVENIKRGKNAESMHLSWNGSVLNVNKNGTQNIEIPAIGTFKVMNVKVVQEEEQYALIQFSDPLMIGQSLEGLIEMSNLENVSYTILGSEVKVYASNRMEGNYIVNINEGILNQWQDKLNKAFTANIFFENRLPNVKIHGKGVILPNSGGRIVLPFDATNLKAVDIAVIKVYENNIPQFLQSNKLDGEQDLRRVASPLVQVTLKLDNDKSLDLHKRNRFLLDLNKYIIAEPGAIYRVCMGFRPQYSLYTCNDKMKNTTMGNNSDGEEGNDYSEYENNKIDENDEFWTRYNNSYPYGYNWDQKDNPCSKSYFNKDRFDNRNILSTNIGLTAKRGNNNILFVATNNIISTEPLADVNLQVLDYQLQIIGKGTSNTDGIALIDVSRKPYLLIAKKGNEKSYLKLDDGSSLPLSRFDVGGSEVKNGIKGFIFGERGVWRPGDSLFLGFIIEDKNNKLPRDHPIEMELFSPKGQLYKRMVLANAEDGFNIFKTATDASAPTGNWLCKIKVGGASFEKKLKIETVMPNRLKIDLNFNGITSLGKNNTKNATLTAKWLFGATAQNLKAKVDAQLYKTKTVFDHFKGYEFDNPTSSFTAQSKTIFDGSLNSEGVATINPSFDGGKNAPGMLLANLMVKVFEPGGNFSIDNVSMKYNPYSSYVGIHLPEGDKQWGYLLSGKTHSLDIIDVVPDGTLTSGNTQVELELYKIQWRWWWDNSGDNMSNFTQDNFNKLIKKETVILNNGKGSYNLKLNASDYGRYLILLKDNRSGHKTGKVFFVDNDNWQSRSGNSDPSAAAMLSFTSDKSKYEVGEEVKLTIPSSKGGKALISIETGSKVFKNYFVNTTQGQTKFSFKTEKEMSPNIYINVSLIQPHSQTINDLPIRMYGVIPIVVEDKSSILHPLIKINEVIKPETNTSISISEQNGKNMTYVIAIVDEGLLDLTRFKTPNPHDEFYAKEALGVKSWDIYDYVIGAWGGELERVITIGGDAETNLAAKTRKANRFKPVVKFLGPFKSNGSTRTHQFILPSYMGSVRVMVIASGNSAYGITEKSVLVKSPLMILPTVPRVLGPGEEFKIPVSIFTSDPKGNLPQIRFKENEFFEIIKIDNTTTINNGEGMASISIRVKNKTGVGKIFIEASLGNLKIPYQTEIDIRNPNPPITQVTEYTLQPNQNWSTIVSKLGDGNSSKATLEVSSIPAINLEKRLNYLIQYPHGCIEQTTSSVFPQLVLNQLMDLSESRKKEIDKNIRIAIQKIQNFQTADGGFSYWPGENNSDEWGTNYAGNFLLEASSKGYIVPAQILQQWKSYEKTHSLSWNVTVAPGYGTDLVQAYRLYLLALAKAPEMGAMNRLREYKFLTPESKWRLAAAYYLSGQQNVAVQLINGLPTKFKERPNSGITFGSDTRDEAMVLETLTLMNRKSQASELVKTIAAKLSDENWYSTQTTAYSLMAIARYCGMNKDGSKINVTESINSISLNIGTTSVISQTNIAWEKEKSMIQLKNKGNNILYVRVINQGQPLSNQLASISNNPNILQVSASYFTSDGKPIDISKIQQGNDFVAKVTIKNPGQRGFYSQMALSQIFPSGWEILNTRLYNSEGAYKSSPADYMDIRDDRVYHYFNLRPNESLTYFVQLNAAYPGKYYWPGVYAEAMYDHTISGGLNGKWIEVTE